MNTYKINFSGLHIAEDHEEEIYHEIFLRPMNIKNGHFG
jgi:hypothetical protein